VDRRQVTVDVEPHVSASTRAHRVEGPLHGLLEVDGTRVQRQAPGIDACGQALKLMELTLATNA